MAEKTTTESTTSIMDAGENREQATPILECDDCAISQAPKTSKYAYKQLCGHINKECVFYNPNKEIKSYKLIFLISLLTVIGFALGYYIYSNYVYKSSFNKIVSYHSNYMDDLSRVTIPLFENIYPDSISMDSKIFIDRIDSELSELNTRYEKEASSIKALMEIQSTRIGNDFDRLMLWASILMIIFLVFSIYAMYKLDDMQNKGNESLGNIYKAHADVMADIKDFHKTYSELQTKYNNEVDAIKKDVSEKLAGITNDLETKHRDIETKFTEYEKKLDNDVKETSNKIVNNIKTDNEKQFKQIIEKYIEKLKNEFNTNKQQQKGLEKAASSVEEQLKSVSTPTETQNNSFVEPLAKNKDTDDVTSANSKTE